MTQKKTAIGAEDWLLIVGALVSLGILPKSVRPLAGTAETILIAVKLGKRLGWF
jgi:hypothetical protein